MVAEPPKKLVGRLIMTVLTAGTLLSNVCFAQAGQHSGTSIDT
jgi:hypothetical protein